MKNKINNKGSVLFVFYFIIGLTLLAVAGYYIGLNEQKKLFEQISEKKQKQEDSIFNPEQTIIGETERALTSAKDEQIKSLIDSPVVVLRNIAKKNEGDVSIDVLNEEDQIESDAHLNAIKNSKYFIKTNFEKKGVEVSLKKGEARGDSCYSSPEGRVCLPKYTFEKIWTKGDLNNDSIEDAIVSILSLEKVSSQDVVNRSYFAVLFGSSTDIKSEMGAGTSTQTEASAQIPHFIAPFNYGIYSPDISSLEIKDGLIKAIGNFYVSTDTMGKPSASKVIKYRVATTTNSENSNPISTSTLATSTLAKNYSYSIIKSSEAKLFKEQGDRVADWLLSNYNFSGLDFSIRTPEDWQKEEKFDNALIVTLKNPDGRDFFLTARKIIQTCSEYDLKLKDQKDLRMIDNYYIDLGDFGAGYYVKTAKKLENNLNGYYAEVCVSDKSGDRVLLGLSSFSKDDEDPYFVMFDKIWSTLKVR